MTRNAIEISARLTSYAATDPGGWDQLFEHVQVYEAAGFDRVVISDHVAFGENIEAYARPETGGIKGGRQPTGPDGHWLEPLTTLSVIAGQTSRIRLSTGILLAALRRPAVLAKTAATLDVLSGGRLDLGVGVGWQKEEYDAAGLDFSARGRLLDHTLEVCQELWRAGAAAYESPELTFEGIHMMPKPLQPGGVPIWVSGRAIPLVAKRLARFGSGWIPWADDAADIATGLARMNRELAEHGTDTSSLRVQTAARVVTTDDGRIDAAATIEGIKPVVEAGATDLVVRLALPAEQGEACDVAGELVDAFRAAT